MLKQKPVGTDATNLPCDVLLDIARRVGPPRRNVMAMRSTCRAWRAGVPNTNGPLLMASHLDTGKMVALQLTAPEGRSNPSLVPCACVCQPPFSAALWGAANGLLSLQKIGTNYLFLYCLNCGDMVPLPRLPPGCSTGCASDALGTEAFGSGGVFFNEQPTKLFAIQFWHYANLVTHRRERKAWSLYPETENKHMKSVAFPNETHFIGISDSAVVVGPVSVLYPDHRNPFSTRKAAGEVFFIDIPAEGDPAMDVWDNFGNHVFRCADRVYTCVMLRSVDDANVVSATVYYVDQLPGGGFTLVRTYNIGPFAVYLGANQALVLPASGSANQAANTIYIRDDDGLNSSARVCALNIASGVTLSIPLPPVSGLLQGDYGRPVWVAPPPLNVPFWHCDTKTGF